jgi:hypothetical protein
MVCNLVSCMDTCFHLRGTYTEHACYSYLMNFGFQLRAFLSCNDADMYPLIPYLY